MHDLARRARGERYGPARLRAELSRDRQCAYHRAREHEPAAHGPVPSGVRITGTPVRTPIKPRPRSALRRATTATAFCQIRIPRLCTTFAGICRPGRWDTNAAILASVTAPPTAKRVPLGFSPRATRPGNTATPTPPRTPGARTRNAGPSG